jgi:predicted transcriptional regulator
MAKKLISVRLSDEAIAILKKLAAEQERSEAFIIEKLLLKPKK